MTYICGFQDNGTNFIICDTRLSWNNSSQEPLDIAVKSGHLFSGCIFARTGDVMTSAKFISAAKKRINQNMKPSECWEQFIDFIDDYPFSKGHFSLLLSYRSDFGPQFYILDSRDGLKSRQNEQVVELGKGVHLLRGIVEKNLGNLDKIRQQVSHEILFPDLAGYHICHNLSLYAQSHRAYLMSKNDVGGIFHFMAQSGQGEHRQRPSLYLSISFDSLSNNIYVWMYRVVSVMNGIIVETYFPPGLAEKYPQGGGKQDILFDNASTQGIEEIINNRKAGRKFKKKLQKELKSVEWCYYCGWGFANPKHWGNFGWQINSDDYNAPVTPDREFDHTLATNILDQLKRQENIKGKVTLYYPNKNGQALETSI